jgi:hypothetical protein
MDQIYIEKEVLLLGHEFLHIAQESLPLQIPFESESAHIRQVLLKLGPGAV